MPEQMKFVNLTEDQFRAFIKSAFDEGWLRGKYEKEDKDTLFNNSIVKEQCESIIKIDNADAINR